MNKEWEVGDVVMLKSGGPKMTIVEVDRLSTKVMCSWFTEDLDMRVAYIEKDALMKSES